MKKSIPPNKAKEEVLSVLRYFALFSYPLKISEIHRFCGIACTVDEVQGWVETLISNQQVFAVGADLYSMADQPEWAQKRLNGNRRAEELLRHSSRYVRKIIRFPFVRSVAISGSLSKYYADEAGDIDYFIITKKNRLWIARTLLHLFKKTSFLRKREHFYCMNYLVDESALEIDQKNIYSAIETVTLIPVYNEPMIRRLKKINRHWVIKWLPNEPYMEDLRFVVKLRGRLVRGFTEKTIEAIRPEKLNHYLMTLTDRKWRKKWASRSYPMDQYDQAFYTTLHISKNHPANYQKQILSALDNQSKSITNDFGVCEQ